MSSSDAPQTQLMSLAAKIREWQTARNLSDNALVKRIPQIGSTKTFQKIRSADLSELDVERQLTNYTAAWLFIESIGEDLETATEDLHDDLYPVIALRRAFFDTMRETGIARVIFLLGPTGAGKTTARRMLMEKYGSRLMLVESSVAWNDSPTAMLGEILDALGKKEKPASQIDRLNKVVEILNESRRALIIEEGHHLGPRCLNLLKTLVNRTPGEFILVAIDTLWRKLETAAYEEARQLTGNRLAERINLGRDVRESDIRKIVTRRIKFKDDKDELVAIRQVVDKSPNFGRLAFARDVIKRALEKSDGQAITLEQFTDAIAEEVASR